MSVRKVSHRTVIVGGGAGGLQLAARLGRRYGPESVMLIDNEPFHIWKPSLHEVAAGTLDIHQEGLSYPMLARINRFTFMRGEMVGVDRQAHQVLLGPLASTDGSTLLPARQAPYDTLVVAVGSRGNFFGTPGAQEHAIALDSTDAAEHFRLALLRAMVHLAEKRQRGMDSKLHLVIVGGGATGVELAAELIDAGDMVSDYGLPSVDARRDVSITVVESAPRLLGPLPERVSIAAHQALLDRGIHIETGCRVARVTADRIFTSDGRELPSDLCVWAAGISAPPVLSTLGLPQNRAGQIEVDAHLQTSDPAVFAMGDCAAAPWIHEGKTTQVPARAQAAHQQAKYLAGRIGHRMEGRPLPDEPFTYHDRGSLVSLGTERGVGNLMGGLVAKGMYVHGLLARLMYMSLHLVHHKVVLGIGRTISVALGRLLSDRARPRVKLH